MKHKICVLGLLCLFFQGYGQPGDKDKALKTGDRMPDIRLSGVLNYRVGGKRADAFRTEDFKDRLLILDFWGTYCTPCLHLLPVYDSLQRVFGDRVQFLLVTREKRKAAEGFFKRHALGLPSVTEDVLLGRLFPHNSIPYEVWLRNGVVVATTYGEDVNAGSIRKVLDGDTRGIDQRQDDFTLDPLGPWSTSR